MPEGLSAPRSEDRARSSGDRLLAVLALFTVDQPQWTVEAAASRLGVSATTTYRYFKRLTKAGLITPVTGAGYMLGPAIIQMYRQIQITDPMLRAGRAIMVDLLQHAPDGSTAILCRLFHDRVICVLQVTGLGPQPPVSYENGRPMPLYRGATSKIILAHLPTRALKTLFAHDAATIAETALGPGWEDFRRNLLAIRRVGTCVARGEIDPGRVGVAAPIFDADRAVLGSLSLALAASRADPPTVAQLTPLVAAGAREIERSMTDKSAFKPSPARFKIAR